MFILEETITNIQASHRVVKSGKGKEFQNCIFLAWKGMEFNAWAGKNTEYYLNLALLPSAVAFCHATQVQNMMTYPPTGMQKYYLGLEKVWNFVNVEV